MSSSVSRCWVESRKFFIAHPKIAAAPVLSAGQSPTLTPQVRLPTFHMVMKLQALNKASGLLRWVAAPDLIIGPFMTVIEPNEMLAELVIKPHPPRTGAKYVQVSRQSGGYAQSAVASIVTLDENEICKDVHMVLMSVAEVPILSEKAREILIGNKPSKDAIEAVAEAASTSEIDPASDLHASADYRRSITRVLIVRSLTEAFERAKRGGK